MKTIGLIINKRKDNDFNYAKKVIALLQKYDYELYLYSMTAETDILNIPVLSDEQFFESCDALLTMGGDGTLLQIAEKAAM